MKNVFVFIILKKYIDSQLFIMLYIYGVYSICAQSSKYSVSHENTYILCDIGTYRIIVTLDSEICKPII